MTPIDCPLQMQKAAAQKIKDLLAGGIIEDQSKPTEWCMRGMFLPKAGRPGKARLVLDFRI